MDGFHRVLQLHFLDLNRFFDLNRTQSVHVARKRERDARFRPRTTRTASWTRAKGALPKPHTASAGEARPSELPGIDQGQRSHPQMQRDSRHRCQSWNLVTMDERLGVAG